MLILYIVFSVLLTLFTYLVIDYRGPKHIVLRTGQAFGRKCLRARELIVQEFDRDGNIWASRGLLLYRLRKGDSKFTRIAHVPTGFSYFWLNNFTLFRRFTNKPECLEASISGQGSICAMSAGYMWQRPVEGKRFQQTMRLIHYGLGVGRGILSYGIRSIGDTEVYWGEYFRNSDRTAVRIYKSGDQGMTWEVAHELAPGFTRHIHAILQDPFTGKLWICTGDKDHESRIGWSDDGFKTITWIGTGSQIWRSSHLVFTRDAVYWGTDTGSIELAGIYRWDKLTGESTRIYKSDGAILFGTSLVNGTIIFSTDREGFPNERDKKTRLFLLRKDGHVSEIECGTWKHWKTGYRYGFAMLRFQRNQGFEALALSVINQKEFPGGELLVFDENSI